MPPSIVLRAPSAWPRAWRRLSNVHIGPARIRAVLRSPHVLVTISLMAVSLASVAYIVRALTLDTSAPAPSSRSASHHTTLPDALTKRPLSAGSYDMVINRNLFSPTRIETGAAAAQASAPGAPTPALYGVVLSDDAPVAYLEDPATKRVTGYHTGDALAGGTIGLITADHVVLLRPEGRVEIRLNDPSKPRPSAPQPTPTPGLTPPSSDTISPPSVPRLPRGRLPRES
jgi:hypothetical protein